MEALEAMEAMEAMEAPLETMEALYTPIYGSVGSDQRKEPEAYLEALERPKTLEAALYLGYKLEQMIYRDSISHKANIMTPADIFNTIIVAPRI